MKRLVIINGKGGTGKDTFVVLCRELIEYPSYNFSIVDSVKDIAVQMGWMEYDKSDEARLFLSNLKDSWETFNQGPINKIKARLTGDCNEKCIYFLHMRSPNEIATIKSFAENINYDVITLLVTAKENSKYDGKIKNHADDNVDKMIYDYYIKNDATIMDLKEKAESFIRILEN